MLDLFRRQRPKGAGDSDGPSDTSLRSHIFPKFLKRLSGQDKPAVLDLGRLSGANIEILARLGCRVQVEDLLSQIEEHATTPEPAAAAPLPAVPESPAAAGNDPSSAPAGAAAQATPAQPGAMAASVPRPGQRPTRRIVLPPRLPGRLNPPPARSDAAARGPYRSPLPCQFAYEADTFDALIAWDLFNYYDPESARRMGLEVARIMKPGGLIFSYFHSRSHEGLEAPRRFRIVDEQHLSVEPGPGRTLRRQVFQNRDIEKMFTGLRIAELYFLKNGLREMMLEKKAPAAQAAPTAARPRPKFRIE
jgi:hypothetical protein